MAKLTTIQRVRRDSEGYITFRKGLIVIRSLKRVLTLSTATGISVKCQLAEARLRPLVGTESMGLA
ncbi:hypothetical protein XH88_28540 [Bradyrhizobium sp. CCBAU 51627]|nr:hypothetical protein [Bradyrhizobium sp. CCBAU 51627]